MKREDLAMLMDPKSDEKAVLAIRSTWEKIQVALRNSGVEVKTKI